MVAKAKPVASQVAPPPNPQEIAIRAYQLWDQEGRSKQSAERDWLRAEQELLAAAAAREENTRRRDAAERRE